jgi:hypothetical protein
LCADAKLHRGDKNPQQEAMPSELADNGLHQQHGHGADLRRNHGQEEGRHGKDEADSQLDLV